MSTGSIGRTEPVPIIPDEVVNHVTISSLGNVRTNEIRPLVHSNQQLA